MNGGGEDLGYNTVEIANVAKGVAQKYATVKDEILKAFTTFVTSSNSYWYASHAKDFFLQVAEYVNSLIDKDLAPTMEKFLESLREAADAWKEMTGNVYTYFSTDLTPWGEGPTNAATCVKDYQISLDGKVFMTENCETNVGGLFETFASGVKAAILTMAEPFGVGELIGGNQSEAYINMITEIGTKFETGMAEEKAELEKALHDSREKYVEQAKNVAAVKLEESGE